MEALEEIDLAKLLNFSSSLRFVKLVEEDLAGLILAAQAAKKNCCIKFRPLRPRYATLVQVCAARFGLTASVHGWGDERYIKVRASHEMVLPCTQCTDFKPPGDSGLAPRLRDIAKVSEVIEEECATNTGSIPEQEELAEGEQSSPQKARRGMQGWSDDEEENSWISKRRKASTADGRVVRGRGFQAREVEAPAPLAEDEDVTMCRLQKGYNAYEIDPEDTWSPQRKPYVEIGDAWEFSGAWTFEPESHDVEEEQHCNPTPGDRLAGKRGVLVFKVEHGKGGDFTVAFAGGSFYQAKRDLETNDGGSGEPFVLEFKLDTEKQAWMYRFGRSSQRQAWKSLPWSNAHRTSFWLATYPGDDEKQHFMAGLDEFPERRFFFAKVRIQPKVVGFGPPADKRARCKPFYVRDIAIFARTSLLPPPFFSRDHFVELAGKSLPEAMKACEEAALGAKVLSVAELPKSAGVLLLCRGADDAELVSEALSGSLLIRSTQWVWPAKGFDDSGPGSGPAAAKAAQHHVEESWSQLHTETTRELAIFQEHTDRRVKHLENLRVAQKEATRMIMRGLKGDRVARDL